MIINLNAVFIKLTQNHLFPKYIQNTIMEERERNIMFPFSKAEEYDFEQGYF